MEIEMENNIHISEFLPIETQYPVKLMPQNKDWIIQIQPGMFIENKPPLRRIFINYSLTSEYKIADAEREREAVLYLYLNNACGGNMQKLAKIWGLHRNTIGNYLAAYHNLGIKGLSNLYYKPLESREKNEKQTECVNQITIDEISGIENIVEEEKPVEIKDHSEDIINTVKTSFGGAMLLYPLINQLYEGIFEKADKINTSIKKVFTLPKIILTLIFYFFVGIQNPENSKAVRRKDFGAIIGISKTPCCKTLRAELSSLTLDKFPEYLNQELRRRYIRLGYVELGVIYFDGHFVPYYGKKNVHKGYSTQRRLAMPGHYQHWTCDKNGRPILFYVNNSFTKFRDALIESVKDVLELMKESGYEKPLIIVFDREGYDSKLLNELDMLGVGFIMLKKYHKDIELENFTDELSYINRQNKEVKYKSHKEIISISNYRDDVEAIVILDENTNKQFTLINNLEHVKISKSDSFKIKHLDGRWVQENFFKEAKVKADLDHTIGYQTISGSEVEEDINYEVSNPKYKKIEKAILCIKKKQITNQINIAKMLDKFDKHSHNKTFESFKQMKKNKNILEEKAMLEDQLKTLLKQKESIPKTVKYCDIDGKEKDIFKTERESVILNIKASVFNMRKQFEDIAKTVFVDHRELDKFILTLIGTPARVTYTNNFCYVCLEAIETPVYQRSAEKLLKILNEKNPTLMDGTNRKIIYEIDKKTSL
jgi:hypothetical protein